MVSDVFVREYFILKTSHRVTTQKTEEILGRAITNHQRSCNDQLVNGGVAFSCEISEILEHIMKLTKFRKASEIFRRLGRI